MYKFTLLAFFMLSLAPLWSQSGKTVQATLLQAEATIDGDLSDACWQQAPQLEGFTTSTPVFGAAPHCQTEVRLFYTDIALYVSARCIDPDAGGVRADRSFRDGQMTGDWFQVSLDTWNDKQLAFDFTVSAAGVQSDSREARSNLNNRWESAVQRSAEGWVAEIRIPFSALRYPANRASHTWGLQLSRFDRSTGELSTWSPQDPLIKDVVLQYGTLTGLQDIHQTRRHQLGIYAGTTYIKGEDFTSYNYVEQTLGIDARLGLNESTTLDLSLLPPLSYRSNFSAIIYSESFDKIKANAQLPTPRLLIAEDQNLFERGTYLRENPILYNYQMLWRLGPLPPVTYLVSTDETDLLNTLKLTTRSKGNFRFGIYNAVTGPLKAEFYSSSTGLVHEERLQSATNYNYLAAEYLLPNNGYIHLANASHLAGPGMNTFEPSLDFRVRDRSNGYECAGTLYLSREQIDTNTYQGNRLNLSIGRVNRRWGWRLSHNATDYPVVSSIRMPSIRFANSRAEVQYRSFTPKYGFLNTTATGGVQTEWSMQEGQQTLLSLYANMRVLDRKFRTLGLGLSVIPYEQTQRYQTGGAYLNRKLAPRLEGSLDVASDQRKRLFWSAHLDGGISTRRELPELNTNLAATWVFHPRFSFKAGLALQNIFEFTYLLPEPGRWLFERRNEQKSQFTLDLNWYATRRLGLFGGFGWYRYKFSNREALEIQPDGQLEPVAYELPALNNFSEGTLRFGFQYFFKDISQIRFSYGLNPDANFFEANIGPFYPNIHQRADLSVIWLLGNTGKR